MSAPYYTDELVTLHHGDCLDVLATLPDASVDAVVTDPPYALEFMGRSWDGWSSPRAFQEWCGLWAAECLRVLKPGGHMLAFGGSRTWHRLAAAVEDAGFEVRDSIAWLYGSGFPKSLDVSKAIDRAGGDTGQRVFRTELAAAIAASGLSFADIDRKLGVKSTSCYWVRDDRRACLPAPHHWAALARMLPLSTDLQALYVECEREDREVSGPAANEVYSPSVRVLNAGTPASAAARTWQGWGTALKPAFEPIVVGRKPLAGTVAATVLQHGTGALNIDACRVGDGGQLSWAEPRGIGYMGGGSDAGSVAAKESTKGRWPTNVVLDESQAAELGPEARFFPTFRYEAKAPTAERPRAGEVAHPTVKPLDLMRWLVRLVTPPGGTVLEPFAGSGTTAEACVVEGFHCIAIEREADYLPLITQRLTKPIALTLDIA